MPKTIDPKPIIEKLAERCLRAKGLESSILGELIDMLRAEPDAIGRCKNCQHGKYYVESGRWHCRSQKGLYRAVEPEEFCSYYVEDLE